MTTIDQVLQANAKAMGSRKSTLKILDRVLDNFSANHANLELAHEIWGTEYDSAVGFEDDDTDTVPNAKHAFYSALSTAGLMESQSIIDKYMSDEYGLMSPRTAALENIQTTYQRKTRSPENTLRDTVTSKISSWDLDTAFTLADYMVSESSNEDAHIFIEAIGSRLHESENVRPEPVYTSSDRLQSLYLRSIVTNTLTPDFTVEFLAFAIRAKPRENRGWGSGGLGAAISYKGRRQTFSSFLGAIASGVGDETRDYNVQLPHHLDQLRAEWEGTSPVIRGLIDVEKLVKTVIPANIHEAPVLGTLVVNNAVRYITGKPAI